MGGRTAFSGNGQGGEPAAIVLGTFFTALPIFRALGRKGVQVFGISIGPREVGSYSRFCRYLGSFASEEQLMEALRSFARTHAGLSVLIPTSDRYLTFLSNYREELQPDYRFYHPAETHYSQLIAKEQQAKFFEEHDIPHARTMIVTAADPEGALSAGLTFPLIIRPNLREDWFENPRFVELFGSQKAILVQSRAEYLITLPRLTAFGPAVVSEFIPGESNSLFYFVGFRDNQGRQRCSFVGKKLRTYPDRLGSETLLVSEHNEGVQQLGDRIMERLDYRGVAGVDCKWDPRVGQFKVIEVNFRFGLSDGIVPACGLDLPWYCYCDLLSRSYRISDGYDDGVYWTWVERDLDWLRRYKQEKSVSMGRWAKDHFSKRHSWIAFDSGDPLPFLMGAAQFGARLGGGVCRYLRGKLLDRDQLTGTDRQDR